MTVVFLKGLNVGGHRRFRPRALADQLKSLEVVSIGAAGTFVVRKPATRARLRTEIAKRLPFTADILMCDGGDVLRLVGANPFAAQRRASDLVHFVGLAARRPPALDLPLDIPAGADWCVRVLGQERRFLFGVHRRQMKAIGYLGRLQTLCGSPVTVRSWTTMLAIADNLQTYR